MSELKKTKSYKDLANENKEMLEMLQRSLRYLSCGNIQQKNFIREVELLIKKSTEI